MITPIWVPLCEEAQLQDILSKGNGRSSDQQARIIYDVFGTQLYTTVWKPLEESLEGIKTVYYSPSGLLHKIAFSAIPAENAERLADEYNLILVSSTREVVHFAKNNTPTSLLGPAVLYGGLQYDTPILEMISAAKKYKNTDAPVVASATLPLGLTRGAVWVELPGTWEETTNVKAYLEGKRIPTTLYQGGLGNEESFKALSGARNSVIHLATHGFFLADVEQPHDNNESTQQKKPGIFDNPLLRSGLLLSGGNHAWADEKVGGIEDGILTADEIARLNLLGTQLVVLSACQTGLGDVNNSEGVFGLQRAFKLAGVETLVMSLWEVDDAATSKLMATFYSEWLSGKTKQAAFKEAQRQVRAEYPSPFYWAAFVMMD
jgi:CHAT domain-containing protein